MKRLIPGADPVIDQLIAQNKAKPIPGMERMDEALRDRTAAKRKAVEEAIERRRRELEDHLAHGATTRLSTFGRTREA